MASRGDIDLVHKPTETLRQNKRRAGASTAKMDDIKEKGLVGKDKPIREGKPKMDKAIRGPSGNSGDFDLIMGKTKKFRAGTGKTEQNIRRHQEKKGRSDSVPSTLHIPIVRAERLTTEDGRTSFHFSHDSVAKTRSAVVNETTGRVNRPGAAKAHNKYIERESAVAIDDEPQQELADDAGIDQDIARDPLADGLGVGPETARSANTAINDNDGAAVANREPYFDRPLSRSFLRTYRAALGALLADPEPDPRGEPADQIHGLRELPGRGLVPDHRDAEMLLRADEVPVVGRNGAGGAGVRRAGDGDRQGRGGGDGRVGPSPVPARLSRPARTDNRKAIAALSGIPANDPRTPDGQGRYIERQEALAIQPDGTRVLFTNIDPDAEKRAEFWRLVEEHEREAEPDKITFTIADNAAFWDRVSKHRDCPEKLAAAIRAADPTVRLTVDTDDNVAVRKFLSGVEGFRMAGAKAVGETKDEYAARKAEDVCKFQDGRGGRVQYRIIGELPHELDVKGRASILRKFSEEFEKRDLPFVSVMHAPDHTNNDKNWHFHLVYYDRPCRRLTAEDLANVPADPNEKNQIVQPVSPLDVGRWDFTVAERYKTSSREIRERYPFAQQKVKEVTRQQDWVERMRVRLAEITNDHLEEARVPRRVDPRRHSEMGIHNDPQEHLGTKLANLEAMGIATPKGISNEERQWAAQQERLNGDLERRKSVVDQQARKWLQQGARAAHLDDEAKAQLRDNVTRWHQHRTEAEEHLGIAENLDQHMVRLTSRAMKVRETCTKHLDAIEAGAATKFQMSRMTQLQNKANEAVEYIAEVTKVLADETKLSRECREHSQREGLIADQIELVIQRALMAGGIKQAVEEERRRRAANDERDRDEARNRQVAAEQESSNRRALVKAQMDAWIEGIRKGGRRLVMDGRRIVPMDAIPEDRPVIDAINYASMMSRLAGIKRTQDNLVEDVVKSVRAAPQNVVRQRTDDGETFVFVTSNRTQAKAFRDWASDPAIAEARREAVAHNAEDTARRASEKHAADSARVNAERSGTQAEPVAPTERVRSGRTPVDPARDAARPAADSGAPRTPSADRAGAPDTPREIDATRSRVSSRQALNERIVRAVREEARRISVVDGVASLDERHLRAIGIKAGDLSDQALQKRLVGLASVQDREIKRVTAYARAHTDKLVERDGAMVVNASGPRDIVEISNRWRGEESVDLALRAILETARTGTRTRAEPAPKQDRDRTPAPTPDRTPADAGRTPATDTAQPSSPSDRTTSAEPAARPALPVMETGRPRFTDLTPDYEMREQAKAYAEQQERERREAAERETAGRVERDQRAGEDPVSRAVRIASEKAATNGAHPLIDQWMQSVKDGLPVEERRTLALRITSERDSREKLREIDRTVARRIREDSDRAKDDMQPGLGLDIDRGVTPRR